MNEFRKSQRDGIDEMYIMKDGGDRGYNYKNHSFCDLLNQSSINENHIFVHPSYDRWSNNLDNIDRDITFELRLKKLYRKRNIDTLESRFIILYEPQIYNLQQLSLLKLIISLMLKKIAKSDDSLYKFINKIERGQYKTLQEKFEKKYLQCAQAFADKHNKFHKRLQEIISILQSIKKTTDHQQEYIKKLINFCQQHNNQDINLKNSINELLGESYVKNLINYIDNDSFYRITNLICYKR